MNNVALSSDDRSVLISYENKVCIVFHQSYIFFATHYTIMPYQSPSQFWQLQVDRSNTDFILRHSYMPKESTSFASLPSIFGGEEDHLVLRAGTGHYRRVSRNLRRGLQNSRPLSNYRHNPRPRLSRNALNAPLHRLFLDRALFAFCPPKFGQESAF